MGEGAAWLSGCGSAEGSRDETLPRGPSTRAHAAGPQNPSSAATPAPPQQTARPASPARSSMKEHVLGPDARGGALRPPGPAGAPTSPTRPRRPRLCELTAAAPPPPRILRDRGCARAAPGAGPVSLTLRRPEHVGRHSEPPGRLAVLPARPRATRGPPSRSYWAPPTPVKLHQPIVVSNSAPRDGSLVSPAPRSRPIGENRYRSRRRAPPLGSNPAGDCPSPLSRGGRGRALSGHLAETPRSPAGASRPPPGSAVPAPSSTELGPACPETLGFRQPVNGTSIRGQRKLQSQFLCPAHRGGKNTNSEMGSKG